MMRVYQGKSVYEGIAVGRIRVCPKRQQHIKRYSVEDIPFELTRLEQARKEAADQLEELYGKAVSEVGEAHASIFQAHRLLLQDQEYIGFAENVIRTGRINAEYAVEAAGEHFASLFFRMEDAYVRSRAADIRDVTRRLLRVLGGQGSAVTLVEEPVILVADDLTPSETLQLDRDKILAFVTVHGSVNSHTAILARTMNIPALVCTPVPIAGGTDAGVHEPVLHEGCVDIDGQMAIVDGYSGCLYVDPSPQTLKLMEEKLAREQEKKALLFGLRGKESITRDGRRISVCANIGSLEDLDQALLNDAEGIGLFRSEFLYLGRDTYPTEEEQFCAYKAVAEAMGGKRTVIRTLDIGADKEADYLELAKEQNPAMGCRAVRICLKRPKMFKTQLRALYRAAAYGDLAVLYPMITSLKEVQRIRELAVQAKAELKAQGVPFGELQQGIMIETPAAALISDLLAREADFFSIGTNDLTQYLLAIDRQNGELDEFYDAHHTAVFRMISLTVENAHRAGIRCGICGELAADTGLTNYFVNLGVDELSVSPGRILKLRKAVREI